MMNDSLTKQLETADETITAKTDAREARSVEQVIVFRTAPARTGRLLHFKCVEKAWKAGQFHNPIRMAKDDLEGKKCLICGKLMSAAASSPIGFAGESISAAATTGDSK